MQDCLDTIAQQMTLNYKDNFNDEKISGFSTVKMTVGGNLRQIHSHPTLCLLPRNENEHAKLSKKSQEVSVILHARNQRCKRLKIKNGQNDRSGNSGVKQFFILPLMSEVQFSSLAIQLWSV